MHLDIFAPSSMESSPALDICIGSMARRFAARSGLAISAGWRSQQRRKLSILRLFRLDGSSRGRAWSFATLFFTRLHVGTYTREGTFSALIPHLDRLADLGITTIELMPLSQFPGGRNWGYDGVFPFALQNSYGRRCRPAEICQCGACEETRGVSGCRLQPSWAGGKLPRRIRAVFHRFLSHALGLGAEF